MKGGTPMISSDDSTTALDELKALEASGQLLSPRAYSLIQHLPEGYTRQSWEQSQRVAHRMEMIRRAEDYRPGLRAAREEAIAALRQAKALKENRQAARALGLKTGPTATEVREAEVKAKAAKARAKELDAHAPTPGGWMITPARFYYDDDGAGPWW